MASIHDAEDNHDHIGNSTDDEAVRFTAETHAQHIQAMFSFYSVDPSKWIQFQVADNCAFKKKVAKLLKILHVACKNHLLNLEVNYMVRTLPDFSNVNDSVHCTMLECKHMLRNSALLRNLVDLKPIIHNKNQVATKYLQTPGLSLYDCQDALDMLTEEIELGRSDVTSQYYGCFLKKKYTSSEANILEGPHFENGHACQRLFVDVSESDVDNADNHEGSVSFFERKEKRKRQKMCSLRYKDCAYILGSVGEVERLWSIANYILREERQSLSPIVFESLIFLRVNSRFWDVFTVREAMGMVQADG
ncbi:hypothetical protein FGB62_173g00 [Gracilaria domingensis]|nr:hypothetical protein FGB62_173g00 [Gracilaria domingensis]